MTVGQAIIALQGAREAEAAILTTYNQIAAMYGEDSKQAQVFNMESVSPTIMKVEDAIQGLLSIEAKTPDEFLRKYVAIKQREFDYIHNNEIKLCDEAQRLLSVA